MARGSGPKPLTLRGAHGSCRGSLKCRKAPKRAGRGQRQTPALRPDVSIRRVFAAAQVKAPAGPFGPRSTALNVRQERRPRHGRALTSSTRDQVFPHSDGRPLTCAVRGSRSGPNLPSGWASINSEGLSRAWLTRCAARAASGAVHGRRRWSGRGGSARDPGGRETRHRHHAGNAPDSR